MKAHILHETDILFSISLSPSLCNTENFAARSKVIFIWLFCLSQPKLRRPFDRGRGIFNGNGGWKGRRKLHPIVYSVPERSWIVGQRFQVPLLIQLCKRQK